VPDERAVDYPRGALLPDDAVLVRGGPLDLDELHDAAEQPFRRRHGFYGLSLFAFPGESDPAEVFRRSPLRYPEICVATAEQIREAGFEVRRTFRTRGHCSLIFPDEPSDEDIRVVMQLLHPCYMIGGE
jgi:hypothetical protein